MEEDPYIPPTAQIVSSAKRESPPWQVVAGLLLQASSAAFLLVLPILSPKFIFSAENITGKLFLAVVHIWVYCGIYLGRRLARNVWLAMAVTTIVMFVFLGYLYTSTTFQNVVAVSVYITSMASFYFFFISPGRLWFQRRAGVLPPVEVSSV